MLKDILIIAHFTQVPGEAGNGRFHYIAEKIDKNTAKVEIVTTSFSHRTKKHRIVTDEQMKNINYKLTMLHEPGYKKNVSIKRFYSHFIMGKSLKRYLRNRKKPDVVYCSVPSLDVAKVAAKYAEENNVRFIIDIQDLWPEAFKMVFNIPIISDILFYPMKRQANYIYKTADEIIAVSQTYVDRALSVNEKCKEGHSVYLGTDLNNFANIIKNNKFMEKPKTEIWLVYIGTLGHSYDLTSVIDALKILKDKDVNNIKFIVMGDGPLKSKFESYAKEKDISIEFTGRLSYGEMVGVLSVCNIAVNPIKKGSAGSIINKVGDYAAASLPVVNTQECEEYRDLVDKYRMGYNCINGNALDLAKKIEILIDNNEQREEMAKGARKCAMERFDRYETYKFILDIISNID